MHVDHAYPPSCVSASKVGISARVYVSLWDGHSMADEIERQDPVFPGTGDVSKDVFTRLVHGITVVVSILPASSDVQAEANAAIAVDPTQWVEVSVSYLTAAQKRAAVRLRDRLTAAVATASA